MIHFSELTTRQIPSAHRLSKQAGWNQTTEDWGRLLRINPHGVKVWLDDAGEVRATYSWIGYGRRVAWIGMVLVDETYRGRGLGKLAFELALKDARERGFATLGLDATDLGEPIYSKFGFETTVPVVRWLGRLESKAAQEHKGKLLRGLASGLLEFDLRCSGEDRSRLLNDLAATAAVFRMEEGGETVAYAALRPGRTALQIGPVVASSREAFSLIFKRLSLEHSDQNIICDVLNPDANAILTAHGLQPSRHLKRMTSPREVDCLCGAAVWCGAGFEWG